MQVNNADMGVGLKLHTLKWHLAIMLFRNGILLSVTCIIYLTVLRSVL